MSTLLGDALSPSVLRQVAGRPVRAPFMLLHHPASRPRSNLHTIFLAEAGASRPFAVVKLAKGKAIERLRNEQIALKMLHSQSDKSLAGSCPYSVGPFHVEAGAIVTVQRCMPGRSIYAQVRSSFWPRGLVPTHFDSVVRWLTGFHAATRQSARPLEEALLREEIEKPLLAAAERFGSEAVPTTSLQACLELARAHLGQPIRLAAEHGDFWSANVLLGRGVPGVVDWEYFRDSALPGLDMFLFCAAYGMDFPWRPFGWRQPDVTFSRTFLYPTLLSRQVLRLLSRTCAASGLPPTLVPVMLPVALCRMALRRAERWSGDPSKIASSWLEMLQVWWDRPADNVLESWAAAQPD